MATPAAGGSISIDLSDVWDPTIISLWKRIYSLLTQSDITSGMLVCRSFCQELPSLVTRVYAEGIAFGQRQLAHLAKTFTNLQSLTIGPDHSNGYDAPKLDFWTVQLPALVNLKLDNQSFQTCSFTQHNTPKLQSLSIECCEFAGFDLDLPELTSLSFEHAGSVGPLEVEGLSNFGPSISSCPKLKSFYAYQLWGLSGGIHKLDLPECESFEIRSDHLRGLELRAPKLRRLGLCVCSRLEHLRLLDDPKGTQPTPLVVNLRWTTVDEASQRHLDEHPRVREVDDYTWYKENDHYQNDDDDEQRARMTRLCELISLSVVCIYQR